ncbi:MAG TPA: hypothetical protein ENJ43_06890 [Gammaproteobacteria bacterium]|nr:hypothetical protein [Gammaproteobacteria bacterium]
MKAHPLNYRYAVALLLLLLAGCSTGFHLERGFVNSSPAPQRGMSVLVVPFRNLTTHPGAGLAMGRIMAAELYQQGVFAVHEAPGLNMEREPKHGPVAEAVAQARAAGADAVLSGSVTEFDYRRGFRKQPVVGVSIRLVRTDGTVLWAVSATETGNAYLGRDSLTGAAQRMAMRLVQALALTMKEEKP